VPSYKNLWSLNVDEAVVAGKVQEAFRKQAHVFFPLNAQLKDVDLLITNLRNRKSVSIQVKGSKAFEPRVSEIEKYGGGSVGWFFIPKSKIVNCSADYFIFLLHIISDDFSKKKNRKRLTTHLLTIKPAALYKICKQSKILHKNYSFYIWVDPKQKRAFDFRDSKKKGIINLTKYLDESGLRQVRKHLRIK
jgi:hypothetical protein